MYMHVVVGVCFDLRIDLRAGCCCFTFGGAPPKGGDCELEKSKRRRSKAINPSIIPDMEEFRHTLKSFSSGRRLLATDEMAPALAETRVTTNTIPLCKDTAKTMIPTAEYLTRDCTEYCGVDFAFPLGTGNVELVCAHALM